LMGRLFSQANNRKKQRHMDCRPDVGSHFGGVCVTFRA
jgi:hypothetical protein